MTQRWAMILLTISTILLGAAADARPIKIWAWDELVKTSDLVVIAEAKSTSDASDKPAEPSLVAVNTTFNVKSVIKGPTSISDVKMLHFRSDPSKPGIDNGPRLLKLVLVRSDASNDAPAYMMFLKRLPDGRYIPASGQLDPVDSVFELVAANGRNRLPQDADSAK